MSVSYDPDTILRCIRACFSNNSAEQQQGEQTLHSFETQPGFALTLLNIIIAGQGPQPLDDSTRQLATIFFKVCITKYWRKNAANRIADEEKQEIRQKLVHALGEKNNAIALQVALIFAKIARTDYQNEWPDILPMLINGVQSENPFSSQRCLLTVYHVLKELSSKCTPSDRARYHQVAQQLLPFATQKWDELSKALLSAYEHQNVEAEQFRFIGEVSVLYVKLMRVLLVYGFKKFSSSPEASSATVLLVERLPVLYACRQHVLASAGGNNSEVTKYLTSSILFIGKTLLKIRSLQPLSFVPFLKPCLEMYCREVMSMSVEAIVGFERFAIQAMTFVQDVIKCSAYRPRNTGAVDSAVIQEMNNRTGDEAQLAKECIGEFFSQQVLQNLCEVLITRYMSLKQKDLEEWENDPEGFVIELANDDFANQPRPCAENLFISLLAERRDTVGPLVAAMWQNLTSTPIQQVSGDLNQILARDSMYTAIALGHYDLYDYVPFEQWYKSHLVGELAVEGPLMRIIHRRIVWMISYWVENISEELRPAMYEKAVSFLEHQDIVIRLTASTTLHALIDDCQFDPAAFAPFAERVMSQHFALLSQAEESDTKLAILKVISVVIEGLGTMCTSVLPPILQQLPVVWSTANSMMKTSLVVIYKNVVSALGSQAASILQVIIPVIAYATDVDQPDELFLMEDGLELWQCALQCAPSMSPELMALFPNIPRLLERDFEYLKKALKIMESYVLMGQHDFLVQYGHKVAEVFEKTLTNTGDRGTLALIDALDVLLQCVPKEFLVAIQGALARILDIIIGKKESDWIIANYLAMFARVILHHKEFFLGFMSSVSASAGRNILGNLLDEYCARIDNMALTLKRKLSALALLSLLPSQDAGVNERLGDLLNLCNQVTYEVIQGDGSDPRLWQLSDGEEEEGCPQSLVDKKRHIFTVDPVNTTNIQAVFVAKMHEAKEANPTMFDAAMAKVDPAILEEFGKIAQSVAPSS